KPDTYEVLVYAWVPDQPTTMSRTRQDQAPSYIDVGGAWPGSHAVNVTYARYIVVVHSDGVLSAHSGLAPGMSAAALNGIQIRRISGAGGGSDESPGSNDAASGCNANGARSGVVLAMMMMALVLSSGRAARPHRALKS